MAQIRLLHSKPTTCSSYPSLLHLRPQGTAPFVNCIVPHRLSTTTCSRSSPSSFPRTRGDLGPNWSFNCFCHHQGHLPLLLPCCSLDFTPTIQGPHGKGTGIFHLTRSPQIYKKLYNKCFFWRHLLRPRQLDLPLAILIRVSAVPWTPRPLQRVVALSGPTPFPSTPVLQAWLCAVHRSMALAAVCACHRLASRGCAFHFRVPSAYTVRYILQPALRSLARLILS